MMDDSSSQALFERIAIDLLRDGYSILPNAFPEPLSKALSAHSQRVDTDAFKDAGIGRSTEHMILETVRKDAISWITADTPVGSLWLAWAASLQLYLNRRLFLGLFSFESHFAHYAPGAFYKRHFDAFKGDTNRIVSLVAYLNHNWQPTDGGEIVIFKNDADVAGLKVPPRFGTLAVFLSEDFAHEVLPTTVDRHSIAGWFRVNTSTTKAVDPPR
ncbi:MAG: SM-20-related protein [Reinekea sp.]|jgi:SM-20-related protein|uniref:2OG-Fe(II) oxygenase n=1 Tax=Reinekea sp. TaxID=1970455 RepID=UPI0039891B41